jgi:arylsulfatase A-like enzyme
MTAKKSASQQPNVIVFFTDQQRSDTTGVHGNPMGLTPNFDRVAQEGTHCYNAFTCQPVCTPARLVLQTGRYASQFGSYNNAVGLPLGETTIAHHFRDAGYQTAYIGKWHLAKEEPVPKEQRTGYDYWLASNALEHTSDAYQVRMSDNDGNPVDLPGYRVDAVTDAVIRYVDTAVKEDKPFFLFTSFIEPHFQNSRDDYPAPTGYEQKYLDNWMPPDLKALGGTAARHLPGYYGMVKRLDEAFGRVLDTLKSLGIEDDTIVLFTTDHGCHFKTRNSEYKRSCHESSVRIPMALTGPGFKSGGRLQEMVSLVDVPPTLLDACGIDVPDDMQGRSFVPLTKERVSDWPEEVLVEMFETNISRCVRTHRWKYSVRRTDKGMNIDDGWTFEEDCLYDLKADPYELNNVITYNSHRPVADVMKERLLRRMKEAGEPEPEIIDASETGGGQKRLADSELYE